MGTYTEVTDVVAPDSVVAGSTVNVTMTIKNKWTATIYVAAIAVRDTVDRFINWQKAYIAAGASMSFSDSFIMPAEDVVIHAYSYYWGEDEYWHFDDERTKNVSLGEAEAGFSSLEITGWERR